MIIVMHFCIVVNGTGPSHLTLVIKREMVHEIFTYRVVRRFSASEALDDAGSIPFFDSHNLCEKKDVRILVMVCT